jgi:hypothetical protein
MALQAEYYHLQKTIEDFDGRALTIKAWSVTFGLASLVGAFVSRASLVFLIAAAGAALFWLLESFWKAFQLGYYARIEKIEAHHLPGTHKVTPNPSIHRADIPKPASQPLGHRSCRTLDRKNS